MEESKRSIGSPRTVVSRPFGVHKVWSHSLLTIDQLENLFNISFELDSSTRR